MQIDTRLQKRRQGIRSIAVSRVGRQGFRCLKLARRMIRRYCADYVCGPSSERCATLRRLLPALTF